MRIAKLAILLVVVGLTFLSAGYFVVFKIFQSHIRAEVKAKIKKDIPKEDLIKFEISADVLFEETNKIKWKNDGKEIEICGNLYDIVKVEKKDKNVTLWLLQDFKEKALLANLDFFVNSYVNDSPVSKSENKLISQVINFKFLAVNNTTIFAVDTIIFHNHLFEFNEYIFLYSDEILLPPKLA